MKRQFLILLAVGAVQITTPARADYVLFRFGGYAIAVEGAVTKQPNQYCSFRHKKFGELVFRKNQVLIFEVTPLEKTLVANCNAAYSAGDANKLFEEALQGLRRGFVREFKKRIEQVVELDPKHAGAKRVAEIMAKMDVELPDDPKAEAEFLKHVPEHSMRIDKSAHFMLLNDTSEKPRPGQKQNLAAERLELLEQVFEVFLLYFRARGVNVEVPKHRLRVVFFREHKDYLAYSARISPALIFTAGFCDPITGISYFYDQSTGQEFQDFNHAMEAWAGLSKDLKRIRVRGLGDIHRLQKLFSLLGKIWQERQDVTVVSHETTHQLAAATGLFPSRVVIPQWVHEGLASFFEAPRDAAWSGLGAVNEERILWYKALQNDRRHSNISFIVGDQIFKFAADGGSIMHGYGQAWALTHFLFHRHFDELMHFYQLIGEVPPHLMMSPELLNSLFDRAMKNKNRAELDNEWRAYMHSLKTDLEITIGKKLENVE